MIVERVTWKVNHIHQSEFIELLKALVEAMGHTPRVCSCMFGPADTVTSELEFETMEDREKSVNDFDLSMPEYVAYVEKYPELAETGMTRELLRLH